MKKRTHRGGIQKIRPEAGSARKHLRKFCDNQCQCNKRHGIITLTEYASR